MQKERNITVTMKRGEKVKVKTLESITDIRMRLSGGSSFIDLGDIIFSTHDIQYIQFNNKEERDISEETCKLVGGHCESCALSTECNPYTRKFSAEDMQIYCGVIEADCEECLYATLCDKLESLFKRCGISIIPRRWKREELPEIQQKVDDYMSKIK